MRARVVLLVLVIGAMSAACNGLDVPGFCGVSDDIRVTIGNADPDDYPALAGQHVQELKDSAADLSGDQAKLANKVVRDLERASETEPNSLEFAHAFNKFVDDSNRFDHKYCNPTEGPDF